MAEVSNAVPELVVSGYYYSPRATISQEPLRHVVRLKRWSGDRRSRYSWKLSQKEAKYELDTIWVLCLCKMKSHGQATYKYNGLGKKCTTQCFTASKNGNEQYGLLLEIDTNLGIAHDS